MAIGAPTSPAINEGVPSGAIMQNDNDGASLPTGFVLCDGANGTPDLRGGYVKGASGTGDEGNTGGANSVTLSTSEMPAHSHDVPAEGSGQNGVDQGAVDSGTESGTSAGIRNTGGGSAHQNEPSFTELRYMMKT